MQSFEYRSYSTNLFRPKPSIYEEVSNNMLIIATPWGPRSSAEKALQTIQDYYFSARSDKESTSPFEFLDCLSGAANDLRVATMLANDKVYKDENESEYTAGIELFSLVKDKEEVSYIQIGHPSAILCRENFSPIVLGNPFDLVMNSNNPSQQSSPLPGDLLGVYEKSNFAVNSFTPKSGDQLLLLSRSLIDTELFQFDLTHSSLDEIVQAISANDEVSPFWVGRLTF